MVRTLEFSLPRPWVQSLVGVLRLHMMHGKAKKFKKLLKKYETEKLGLSVHWCQINPGGRVLSEIEKDSFIVCRAKGDTLGFCLEKLGVSTPENWRRLFMTVGQRWGV